MFDINIIKEILHWNKNKWIKVSQLAKTPTLIPDWWISLSKKRGNNYTALKGTQRNTQTTAINVDIF